MLGFYISKFSHQSAGKCWAKVTCKEAYLTLKRRLGVQLLLSLVGWSYAVEA